MTETVTIEKQVWESTLHRSMVLQAENDNLKELLKRIKDYLPEYTTPMTLLVEIEELLGEE